MVYFCHACDRNVPHAMEQDNGELLCSVCLEPYVEILERDEQVQDPPEQPQQRRNNVHVSFHVEVNNNGNTTSFSSGAGAPPAGVFENLFSQFPPPQGFGSHFFTSEPPSMSNGRRHNSQNIFSQFFGESLRFGPSFRQFSQMRSNADPGDFFVGDMNTLLAHLQRQHEDQGPAPATEDAIGQLEIKQLSKEDAEKLENETCAVCQDKYKENDQVTCLPCKHIYHKDCVIPWLKMHCTCPVCRTEVKANPVQENDKPAGLADEL